MRILSGAPRSLLFLLPGLLGGACAPSPIDDPLGWNGRGTPLPAISGAGGSTGGAGTETDGGLKGTGTAGIGAAGTGGSPGTGAGGAAGAGGAPTDAGASSAGAGGGGGSSSDGADAGPPVGSTCRLSVTVTTHSAGGGYAPENVEAIWIEDAGGKFVKSLYVMASRRIQHLDAWNAATAAAGLSRNRVDAVTGASLPNYGTRMANWNCTDVNRTPVATGGYQVCFDLNDDNGSDTHTCDRITVGNSPMKVMPPDALPCFTGRILIFTP